MNFDLDDPLGDLLSDDDDSDGSFFGGALSKKKTPSAAKKLPADTEMKKANLFGVDNKSTDEKNSSKVAATSKLATSHSDGSSNSNGLVPVSTSVPFTDSKPFVAQTEKSTSKKETKSEGITQFLFRFHAETVEAIVTIFHFVSQ